MKRDEYGAVAKAFHWLIALLIFILFPLAWVMDEFSGLQKFQAYNLHKSIGITVLGLMIFRVLWRLARPAPELPWTMPPIERRAARIAHFALYLLLFLMPLSGWAMISASQKPSVLYQLTLFPRITWLADLPVDERKFYEHLFEEIHMATAYALLAVIGLHVAAVLRHAFLLKDGVASRMMFRLRKKPVPAGAMLLAWAAIGLPMLSAPRAALAVEWSVNPQNSKVEFEATGGGYTTRGTFGQYKTDIQFDPDAPEQASIRVLFNMKSVKTDSSDADSALQSAEFFNTAQYPTALFVAKGAKPMGDDKYLLEGQLTMKGVTKPVTVPFTIDVDSGAATVKAETRINRMDFGVGPETVAGLPLDKAVKITLNLKALRLDN